MQTPQDQEQYLMEMLDKSNSNHMAFIKEFNTKMGNTPIQDTKGMKIYRKADETEDYFSAPIKKINGGANAHSMNNANKDHTSSIDREEVSDLN